MDPFTFEGMVIATRHGRSPRLQADDAQALRDAWRERALDTMLLEEARGPVVYIGRQADLAIAMNGARARLTFEVKVRAGRRGIHTVGFELLASH